MIPRSISASSLGVFACPARFKAQVIDGMRDEGGPAALLGTTSHSALEDFVSSGQAVRGAPLSDLEALFVGHYWSNFDNDLLLTDGLEMMARWHKRQDWTDTEVISTEEKKSILVPTSVGDLPFNFIIDRMDRLGDGTIVVVDYKTNRVPMTFDDLRTLPQPQMYGMVARMMHPEAPKVKVMFDFLRHDAIGVTVTKEDNRASWEWLKRTAQQIIDSDGTQEVINKDCLYCPRKFHCTKLPKAIEGGSVLSIAEDPEALAKRKFELQAASKAMKVMQEEIDSQLTIHMEQSGTAEFEAGGYDVSLTSSRRRAVNDEVVAKIVGPEVYAKYASLGVGNLDLLIAREALTPEQATALKNAVEMRRTRAGIRVKPKGPVDE